MVSSFFKNIIHRADFLLKKSWAILSTLILWSDIQCLRTKQPQTVWTLINILLNIHMMESESWILNLKPAKLRFLLESHKLIIHVSGVRCNEWRNIPNALYQLCLSWIVKKDLMQVFDFKTGNNFFVYCLPFNQQRIRKEDVIFYKLKK